jgi:hypothetical protein
MGDLKEVVHGGNVDSVGKQNTNFTLGGPEQLGQAENSWSESLFDIPADGPSSQGVEFFADSCVSSMFDHSAAALTSPSFSYL